MLSKLEKKKRKDDRRKQNILRHIQKGLTFKKIAIKFGISKQRVAQVAQEFNILRGVKFVEDANNRFERIMVDFKLGASISELMANHGITKEQLFRLDRFHRPQEEPLSLQYEKRRNEKIISAFKSGCTAEEIILNSDKILGDPTKIITKDGIYRLVIRHGFRRYPNLGNRHNGGILENKDIIDLIIKLRESKKKPLMFKEIAAKLNKEGYRTIQGALFSTSNVGIKYNLAKSISNKT